MSTPSILMTLHNLTTPPATQSAANTQSHSDIYTTGTYVFFGIMFAGLAAIFAKDTIDYFREKEHDHGDGSEAILSGVAALLFSSISVMFFVVAISNR